MARGPSLRIPSVAGAVTGAQVTSFARRVGAEPVDVDVTFAAVSTAAARHGMGRRYVGGNVICADDGHSSALVVASPSAAEALGYDPAVWVVVFAKSNFTGVVTVRMVE